MVRRKQNRQKGRGARKRQTVFEATGIPASEIASTVAGQIRKLQLGWIQAWTVSMNGTLEIGSTFYANESLASRLLELQKLSVMDWGQFAARLTEITQQPGNALKAEVWTNAWITLWTNSAARLDQLAYAVVSTSLAPAGEAQESAGSPQPAAGPKSQGPR